MIALDHAWLAEHPLPEPGHDTDKNRRGRVLVGGGSETVPGATALTGEAALRAGAGKLQLAVPARVAIPLGLTMPEAAVFGLKVNGAGELGAAAGAMLATLVQRCDTLVLGPGMGAQAEPQALLRAVLPLPPTVSLVLDAATLHDLADADAIGAPGAPVVLTPHPGEMAAMLDVSAEAVRADPARHAEAAVARFGAVVVLKGSQTWIAAPDAAMLRYHGGGPGLATGGSGDVLAGLIGGLLARGAPPRVAAAWGVWLHGEAGRLLAGAVGALGFLGRELLAEVPALMAGVTAPGRGAAALSES